jgi:hypothetical protein
MSACIFSVSVLSYVGNGLATRLITRPRSLQAAYKIHNFRIYSEWQQPRRRRQWLNELSSSRLHLPPQPPPEALGASHCVALGSGSVPVPLYFYESVSLTAFIPDHVFVHVILPDIAHGLCHSPSCVDMICEAAALRSIRCHEFLLLIISKLWIS